MRRGLLIAYLIFALCVLGAWQQSGVPIMGSTQAPSGATWTFVQAGNHNQNTEATTIAITLTGTTAGHFLVFMAAGGGTTGTSSCSDTTNTYTAGNIGGFSYCYSKITTGGSLTITLTAANAVLLQAVVEEFTDSGSGPIFDLASTQDTFSSGTTWTGQSMTTTAANDNVLMWGGNQGTCSGSGSIFTGAGGWTIPTSGQIANTNSQCMFAEYQFVTSATAYTPSATLGTSNSGFGAQIAFKP